MPERSTAAGFGYRIDHWSPRLCFGLGAVGAGAIVAPLAVGAGVWGAAAGTVVSVAGGVWVASRGRPIAKLEPPPLPRPVPDIDEPLEMVELEGGTFFMGSPENEPGRYDNEGPVHAVTLSPFAMAKVPTTQALYREIMSKNPGSPQGDDLPVNNVDFFDAVRFCNALSERVGLRPSYSIHGDKVQWDRTADGYRLPTEAEWEYAARAGTRTRYFFGDDEALLGEYAWFSENARDVHPVGKKRPNGWGLHDLHGNVWEWCWDWYGPYGAKPERDPVGAESSSVRVLRGGSFVSDARLLRSALRNWDPPAVRVVGDGFRCVRGSRRQPGG